jgi:formylglycine-generating enzyme required for sulfatase activity
MGFALTQALRWSAERRDDIAQLDQSFIELSRKATQRRKLRVLALVAGLAVAIGAVLAAWRYEQALTRFHGQTVLKLKGWFTDVQLQVLTEEAERALKPGDPPFKECTRCPEMLAVPVREFIMGSPKDEKGRAENEDPQHKVVFANRFAVSKFELTFDEWDTCVAYGGCPYIDSVWGRGQQPAINVSWYDAKTYVAWLSRITGKKYRLLSEAEWEYAARAGSQMAYPWGDEIGKGNANCGSCGSEWDHKQTTPVGQFPANDFGLHDMQGNVWEWVEDCYHGNYNGAPTDGSAWTTGDCSLRVVRGGSWYVNPENLRSARRIRGTTDDPSIDLGFRVGRTLLSTSIPA